MNLWTNLMKPEAEAELRLVIGAIPGVAIRRLTATSPPNINTMGLLSLNIILEGWSPCLNLLPLTWNATIYQNDDADAQAARATTAFADHLAVQGRRFTEAMAIGRAAPFDVLGFSEAEITQIDHVLVDRALAAIFGARHELRVEVEACMEDLHAAGSYNGLEERLTGGRINVVDHALPLGYAFDGRVFLCDVPVGKTATYNGRMLRVAADIPETILTAAVGGRIGKTIETPAALAEYIVEAAWTMDGVAEFRLTPNLATIRELTRDTA